MKERIVSVGIDIGTSTTQLVFSRIHIENMAALHTVPRIGIVAKELIYKSAIRFTPLASSRKIDGPKLQAIVAQEYEDAGIRPSQVQTGAVIITGETARKANAADVQQALSRFAGEFVVATAGPALEGIIAGKGANADRRSKEHGAVVANLDIGGGTTNIAVFQNGDVIDTACLDIGGRLVKLQDGRITYCADKIGTLARAKGLAVETGAVVDKAALEALAGHMVRLLEEVLGLHAPSPELAAIVTDKDLRRDYPIDYLSFSGGVADCMDDAAPSDPFEYGDMGILLGRAIAASPVVSRKKMLCAAETIRATVVGAGAHTMDVSGSTIAVSEAALPLQNIPILKLSPADESLPMAQWGSIIHKKVNWFRLEEEFQAPALAFKGPRNISFEDIGILASAIIGGMAAVIDNRMPLIVVVQNDLAKALGQTLRARMEANAQIICIDTVTVENGDYIDIGRPLVDGRVVPVVVKTLVFNG